MRASRAASSSVYDGCGGCGAPGSGRSVWGCCCWGAAEAEYQLLGADGRRVAHAVPAQLERLPEAEGGALLRGDGHGRASVVVEKGRRAALAVVRQVEEHGQVRDPIYTRPEGPPASPVRGVGPAVLT